MEQMTKLLVDAKGLREFLFAPGCQPCIKTIRRLTAARKIPSIRFGRRVLYDVELVRKALSK